MLDDCIAFEFAIPLGYPIGYILMMTAVTLCAFESRSCHASRVCSWWRCTARDEGRGGGRFMRLPTKGAGKRVCGVKESFVSGGIHTQTSCHPEI
jgi:hypothetical protein